MDAKKVYEGEIVIREFECGSYYSRYGDIAIKDGYLTEEISEYEGKKVKITIEIKQSGQ
ncbi:hypothetical protein NYE67_20530 [Solibacillus sp. FSL W8-0474]|uniref:hypothetical protein n=1 Tax=Solibacillus sp. FSL W8-0474 TaxID=2975336 RepID=UPI0030F5DD05